MILWNKTPCGAGLTEGRPVAKFFAMTVSAHTLLSGRHRLPLARLINPVA